MIAAWDAMPLARAILADRSAPPLLVLAAASCVFLNDRRELTELAYAAAVPSPQEEKTSSASDASQGLR